MSIRNHYLKTLLSTVLLISFSGETSASMSSTVGLLTRRHFDESVSDLKTSVSQSTGISQEDMQDLKITVSGYLQDVDGILNPLIEAVTNRVFTYPIPIRSISNWKEVAIPRGVYNAITYGDGTFMAVGDDDIKSVSQDGQEWNLCNRAPIRCHWYLTAYKDGMFFGIGWGIGTNSAFYNYFDNSGGARGGGNASGIPSYKSFYPQVGIDNSSCVFVGNNEQPYMVGSGFTSRGDRIPNGTAKSIAYGDGKYVVTCTDGSTWYSPDLSGWVQQSMDSTDILATAGCAFGMGKFIALNGDGLNYLSSDGSSWTSRTSFGGSNWESITFGEGLFFAVSSAGRVASSGDGLSWKFATIDPGYKMAAVGAESIVVLKRDEETNTALLGQGMSLTEFITGLVSRP